jgi:hypothetical protein
MNAQEKPKPNPNGELFQPALPAPEASVLPPVIRGACVELLAEMLVALITLERKERDDER